MNTESGTSETATENNQQISSISASRLLIGIVIIGICGGAYWAYRTYLGNSDANEQALEKALGDNEALQKQMANLEATLADIQTANLYQQQEETLARDEIRILVEQTDTLRSRLSRLEETKNRFESMLKQLIEGIEGQRIASDPTSVDLMALIIEAIPKEDELSNLEQRLDPLHDQLQVALEAESVTFKPSIEYAARIEQIGASITKTESWYGDHTHELEAIRDRCSELDVASRTLGEALAVRDAERAQQRVELLAENRRRMNEEAEAKLLQAESESNRAIAEAQAEAIRLAGEDEAERIVQAAKERQAEQLAELKRREEEARLAKLRNEFEQDLVEVRQYLHPFISDGFTHRADDTKGPMSLGVIRGRGALNEGKQGLERLLALGGTTNNDRDRGGFPMFIGGRNGDRLTDWDYVQRAQEFLIKYGEILVEKEMLAP